MIKACNAWFFDILFIQCVVKFPVSAMGSVNLYPVPELL